MKQNMYGADSDWNDSGWSALMHAAKVGSPRLCELLLRAGADAHVRSRHGLSASGIAARELAADDSPDRRAVSRLLDGTLWASAPSDELCAALATCAPPAFRARVRAALLVLNRATGGCADAAVMDTLARALARLELT